MWIKRSGYVYITLILMLVALSFRMYYVAFGGISSKVRSVAGNRRATIELYNSKGIIYDRNLCPLAGNQFIYYLLINPRVFDRQYFEYICNLTNTDPELLNSKLSKESVFILPSYYQPDDIDGVYVYEGTARYPINSTARHIVGYLDSEGKLGLSGVEKAFNNMLSSYSAKKTITYSTNAVRGIIPGLGMKPDSSGDDTKNGVILTIDKELSDFAEKCMDEYFSSGAVVVMDCNSGEILTLSSSPEYNPNKIQEYIDSKKGELINNAMVNQTVGSVFKMVVTACAIMNGYEDFKYNCSGGITVGERVFSCQNKKGHGELCLSDAFACSCNSYYIALGELLGYDRIIETAQLFGADSSMEIIQTLYCSGGNLPSDDSVQGVANLSIGQGTLMLCPLEIARITAVMCNGGYLLNPTIYNGTYIDGIIDNTSEYVYKSQIVPYDTAEKLKKMCIECVVNGTGGTALPEIGGAGGKTASAQTGRYDQSGAEILNTYFTGFYPAQEPKYVITVYANNGVSGSKTCAPVFKEICDFISQNY